MKISPVEDLEGGAFGTAALSQSTVSSHADSLSEERPLVSIILSNYNYADYVGRAIDSALKQTYPKTEVIVVDDGSTDHSASVIEGFSGESRLQLVYQQNAGQAAAMNRGFELSRGEIVIFLDSDDYLHPDAVATVVASWATGLSHMQFPLELVNGAGERIGLHPFSRHMEDGDIHWQLVVAGHFRFMPTSGNAFSRHALARIFPIPQEEWRICADTYIAMMSPKSGPVMNLDVALGFYRVHGLNNWYTEVRSAEKLRTIWQNHIRTWRTLIRHIEVETHSSSSRRHQRRVRDSAALYQWRRVITGQHRHREAFTGAQRRSAKWAALRDLARARMPARQKLLYLAFIVAMAAGAYEYAPTRACVNHHRTRPAFLRTVADWAKGRDFYAWMGSRKRRSQVLAEIPLDAQLQFGRQGTAREFQWYGWTRSDLYADWCIGAEAALVASSPATTETLVLELEVQPMVCDLVPEQRLEILANDVSVYRGNLKSRTKLKVEIASDVWLGKAELVVRFLTPDFFVPRFLVEGVEDHRPLSFSFYGMKWSILSPGGSQTPSPYLPAGQWVSLETQGCPSYGVQGWSRLGDGLLRMSRRVALLRASVLEPSAGDHLLSLEFQRDRDLPRVPLNVQVQSLPEVHIDLAQQSRLDVVIPRGVIPRTGDITVTFKPGAIIGASSRNSDGDGPAGPALRKIRIQKTWSVAKKPVFQPGRQLDFRDGGNGAAYVGYGWHKPEESGIKSSDLAAALVGIWVDYESEAFITALVRPACSTGPLAAPTIKVLANDVLLARYTIDGASEITAILPAGLISQNRLLQIEFQTDSLLRPSELGDQSEDRLVGFILQSLMVS